MSTHATIAMTNENGTVSSIYCHYDGYVENTGLILHSHFNYKEKVHALIHIGNIKSISESLKETSDDAFHEDFTTFSNLAEFLRNHDRQEYTYLFDENKWFVVKSYYSADFIELDKLISEYKKSCLFS